METMAKKSTIYKFMYMFCMYKKELLIFLQIKYFHIRNL